MSHLSFSHPAWSGDFHGVIPVIPTPFDERDQVDIESLGRLVDFAAAARVKAACLPAYGSELYKLSEAELADVVREAVRVAGGRLQRVAHWSNACGRMAARLA